VAVPALQALLANLAPPGQSGALLGAVGSMTELTGAISSTLYAGLLATFATSETPKTAWLKTAKNVLPPLPGMHFLAGSGFSLLSCFISVYGLNKYGKHPALSMGADKEALAAADL